MINEISYQIKSMLNNFSETDTIIFNNQQYPIDKNNFIRISESENKTIAFIDGGQAEIISTGTFCLSFIRVFGIVFDGPKKLTDYKNEFYLFTKAVWKNNDLVYESKIFPLTDSLISVEDLEISSNDNSIKIGSERAPISKVTNMARRFAELSLAATVSADYIVIDGTLEATFKNEEKYLTILSDNVCGLAKSSSLFTTSGNSPIVLLNKLGPQGCWQYLLNQKTKFVKLHPFAKHVFRFEGNSVILSSLISNCSDALFLGYPYGLILVDKLARVSNQEKKSLMARFLLKKENKEIIDYLHSSDAHGILDSLG